MRSRFIVAVLLAAGLLLTISHAAEAGFTVVYYSAPEKIYGWCAGYNSGRSHNCASNQCVKHGGTACRAVVECGGYGAVAYAEKPAEGFGASCAGDTSSARRMALIACMTESKTICWTDVTFTPNGKTVSDNDEFDRTWYAQISLNILNLYKGSVKGETSPGMITAITDFQDKLGRPRTGVIDNELVRRLIDAVGGTQLFAKIVDRDIAPTIRKSMAEAGVTGNRMYGTAATPAKTMTPSEDLNNRSEAARKLAMAAYLAARGHECTLPAKEANLMLGAVWEIVCDEASFTLIMQEGSTIITKHGNKS